MRRDDDHHCCQLPQRHATPQIVRKRKLHYLASLPQTRPNLEDSIGQARRLVLSGSSASVEPNLLRSFPEPTRMHLEDSMTLLKPEPRAAELQSHRAGVGSPGSLQRLSASGSCTILAASLHERVGLPEPNPTKPLVPRGLSLRVSPSVQPNLLRSQRPPPTASRRANVGRWIPFAAATRVRYPPRGLVGPHPKKGGNGSKSRLPCGDSQTSSFSGTVAQVSPTALRPCRALDRREYR